MITATTEHLVLGVVFCSILFFGIQFFMKNFGTAQRQGMSTLGRSPKYD